MIYRTKIHRTSNGNCAQFVTNREQFNGSYNKRAKGPSIFGRWHHGKVYVVYSFGKHYPMYLWYKKQWYENSDGYSRSTAKHHTQARPTNDTIKLTTEEMNQYIDIVGRSSTLDFFFAHTKKYVKLS